MTSLFCSSRHSHEPRRLPVSSNNLGVALFSRVIAHRCGPFRNPAPPHTQGKNIGRLRFQRGLAVLPSGRILEAEKICRAPYGGDGSWMLNDDLGSKPGMRRVHPRRRQYLVQARKYPALRQRPPSAIFASGSSAAVTSETYPKKFPGQPGVAVPV